MRETGLLDVSANEGVRTLALGFWAEARDAAERLEQQADVEALHDFRVALRRLRSCLRAYDSLLG
ncbi:MAG: CHAD domain-containing protein, partial [Sandaracinaceae bacterium]|nr:CHAD domain-containing protein [Sandaracinaceae bacterium]